jgi:hypothetical protein
MYTNLNCVSYLFLKTVYILPMPIIKRCTVVRE